MISMLIAVLIGLLVITLIVMFIFIGKYSLACRRNQDDLAQLKAKRDKFEALANFYEEQNKDLQEKLLQKENDVGFAQGQQVQGELQVRDVAAELDNLKVQKEAESLKVSGLALTQYEFLQALAHSQEELRTLENESHGLENRNREMSQVQKELENKIKAMSGELERLLKIQQVANSSVNEVIWDPILTEKQRKLVELLHQLIDLYPELTADFAAIEWKKIWMPQIQDLGSSVDGVKGIYRLVLKGDKEKIIGYNHDNQPIMSSYVGQAINIKDRWYQHVKKMIGVMPTGNEKLYGYRPEDFYWCIVEKGNGVDLNESEKYWIDFYCCKEGLNKKR